MKTVTSAQIKRTYLEDYQPPSFLVPAVDLSFELDEHCTTVRSKLKIVLTSSEARKSIFLDGKNLNLLSVCVQGHELSKSEYDASPDGMTLTPPSDEFELEICNSINPSENLALSGLYASNEILCTQCEAQGFRNITYFPDRPDVLSKFTVTIQAHRSKFPVLLANGELQSSIDLPDGKHAVTWFDPFPKPSYLFALVAGPLNVLRDTFVTHSGNSVELCFYTTDFDLSKCSHAMSCLKRAMRWDEEVYGREYDLNTYMIVAVDHFNMGAMENKGLNIFNSKYVYAKPDTATDQDFRAVESVISHEYFHNWSGNRVTLRDWFQLSLKEGFTIFRDQQFSSDMRSAEVQRIYDVNMVKVHQFREDASPARHPVQPDSYLTIDNFYTITVYNKGAEVIRMIHALLGKEKFRIATDLYFERFDGCAATVEDFVACMEQASGISLSQFRLWYKVEGTPHIRVERNYDSKGKTYELTFEQTTANGEQQPDVKPMHIPIRIALFNGDGNTIPLKLSSKNCDATRELVLELKQPRQSFVFHDVNAEPTPSLLRGFSAPVVLLDRQRSDDAHFLMAHDNDGFCRWDACQQVFKHQIQELVTSFRHQRPPQIEPDFYHSFGAIVDDADCPTEFKALLLEPPSEIAIAQTMEVVDPVAVHDARKLLISNLADQYQAEFTALYNEFNHDWGMSEDAAGKRKLKNLCLYYLMSLESQSAYDLALKQFNHATNMTDLSAALHAIAGSDSPQRQSCLAKFYEDWRLDAGVIDKWFRIQSTAAREDTLNRVIELSAHHSFSIHNPNRVYSLIGAFSHSNLYCFHDVNGGGYDFLTEFVLKIDRTNSQTAAQLADAFSEIGRYDAERQQMMYQRIEEIASTPDISINVYEIVSRILSQFESEAVPNENEHDKSQKK